MKVARTEALADGDADTKFLGEFAPEAVFQRFGGLHFPAGEFPFTRKL
jgi:hypothetical protein